jgi:hypothetical protein
VICAGGRRSTAAHPFAHSGNVGLRWNAALPNPLQKSSLLAPERHRTWLFRGTDLDLDQTPYQPRNEQTYWHAPEVTSMSKPDFAGTSNA